MAPSRLALKCLLLLACACSPASEPVASSPGAGAVIDGTIQLLSFSRLQGFAEGVPCDPTSAQPLAAAGMVKRGLEQQGGSAVSLACIGETLSQPGAVSSDRASTAGARARGMVILDAMAAAGVDIWLPGHGDFSLLGAQALMEAAAARGITVLASNLQVSGRSDVADRVILQNGSLRIALLGVLPVRSALDLKEGEEAFADDPDLQVLKPMRRIRELSEEIMSSGSADMVAVLSTLAGKNNQNLCEVKDLHFIVGSSDRGLKADMVVRRHDTALMHHQSSGEELAQTTFRVKGGDMRMVDLSPLWSLPIVIAEEKQSLKEWQETYGTLDPKVLAPLISPGAEGDFMMKYSLHFENIEWLEQYGNYDGSSIAHRAAELPKVVADDPVHVILASQGRRITAAVDGLPRSLTALDPDSSISKPADCISCHQAQFDHWSNTAHANSYDTLAALERHRDSSCLVCHAAGFGKAGGYTDPRHDAPYGGYTCWNCHGVKTFHYSLRRGVVEPAFIAYQDEDAISANCAGCHHQRRSPGFDLKPAMDAVRCPPMRPDEPAILEAYAMALSAVERRRDEASTRDLYFEGRALVGLGRLTEGYAALKEYANTNSESPHQAVEIARLLDNHGDSFGALEVLRNFMAFMPSDPNVNMVYADTLLHATQVKARDPALSASHLGLVAPYDLSSKMDAAELPLRKVQVEALFESGRLDEGRKLLVFLANSFRLDEELEGLLDRYIGGQ